MTAFATRIVSAFAGLAAVLAAQPACAEDRALIIGINAYAGLGADSQLGGAVNDAKLIGDVAVRNWGFKPAQVKVLLDAEASAAAIRDALSNWIAKGTGPGDRALVYFSGHGYFVPDTNGDEKDGRDEILVATDAAVDESGVRNVVLDDEIDGAMAGLKDRNVMLIVDSCHSGTIERSLLAKQTKGPRADRTPTFTKFRGDGGKDLNLQSVTETEFQALREDNPIVAGGTSKLVWTAVGATQVAQEDMTLPLPGRHGVFTNAFVQGLRGTADHDKDSKVSAAELLTYVRTKASAYCDSNSCKTRMDPTFSPGGETLARDMSTWGGTPGAGADAASDPIEAIPPSASSFGVKVAIEPGAQVRLNQEIKFRIESSRAGYLVVLDQRDDGKVYQLFPSTCAHAERTIRANAPLTMPDPSYGCVFTADEKGSGKIIVIVTQDKVPLDALLNRTASKGIEPVGAASQYLGEIAQGLLGIWTGDAQNRPVSWGLAVQPYTID